MEYYSVIKTNELLRHEKTLMHISERSKSGKAVYFTTLLLYDILEMATLWRL